MNGIIVVNKEKGYTSHDVVAIVKKIAQEKVGHTGTLDPNATGVLPLLIGKATLISKYLVEHDKIYVATLQLGIKTTTARCFRWMPKWWQSAPKSPTTTRTTRWPAPLPPITLRSRWRVATGWNLPSGGRNMGCWPKGTGAS